VLMPERNGTLNLETHCCFHNDRIGADFNVVFHAGCDMDSHVLSKATHLDLPWVHHQQTRLTLGVSRSVGAQIRQTR
jgi:hypothetical protein